MVVAVEECRTQHRKVDPAIEDTVPRWTGLAFLQKLIPLFHVGQAELLTQRIPIQFNPNPRWHEFRWLLRCDSDRKPVTTEGIQCDDGENDTLNLSEVRQVGEDSAGDAEP